MGTNYYLHTKNTTKCPHCGADTVKEEIHIGKSSGGWCFSLHIHPDLGIRTFDDWKGWFGRHDAKIFNEYEAEITPEEMLDVITERHVPHKPDWSEDDWIELGKGHYKDEEHFHRANHSERGPEGLLRHNLGRHCVGHGEGTWDYIVGEFS